MNTLSEQFSKKIGRGTFALRYTPMAIIASLLTFGLSDSVVSPLEGLILIVMAPYALLLIIQRLNDLELSRWYALLTLIPLVNLVLGVTLLIRKKGTAPISLWSYAPIIDKSDEKINTTGERSGIKYCKQCGTKHTEDARFCASCGKPFV
ncbi:MAG: DUF805 domain-containing protein [bacterium]|nr:DUF805 domain-containing protein [bacterium]